MSERKTFDVNGFLDSRRIGRTHVTIIGLLILTMMVDGYDIFLIGIILPSLARALDVEPATMTIVFVMQQFGLLLGNFVVGPIADRIGRRVALLSCLLAFGLLTLVTMYATTVPQLVVLRFVAGIFFSGVIPNVIALVSEIVPQRMRASAVSVAFTGYTGGIMMGGLVLAWIVPFGWQAGFIVGGVLPIALCAALFFTLPESLRFLANRRPSDPQIPRLLKRIDPSLRFDGTEKFVISEEVRPPAEKLPILALFRDGRWVITLLLWVGFHMAFIVSNLFGAWKVTVLTTIGGITDVRAGMLMAVQGAAGMLGTLSSGFVMDRYGPTRILPLYLAGASLATAAVAFVDLWSVWTVLAFVTFGYFSNGGLSGINALASISYPSRVRASGVSWAHGLGRAGAMIGPILGGAMIAREYGVGTIFVITAIPQMCAALAIFAMYRIKLHRGEPVVARSPA